MASQAVAGADSSPPTVASEIDTTALQASMADSSPAVEDGTETKGADTAELPPPITRSPTEALGPATEGPIPSSTTNAAGPTLNISLLLQNGNRHPYKIDEKYLRNRKVEARNAATGAFDPKEISGYQLKELIWTDWRSEWEPRPASPSSIRLIHMGKLIEDKAALKDARFNMESSNVVHMTVKPAELENDDETGGKGAGKSGVLRARDGEDRGAGCRCAIM